MEKTKNYKENKALRRILEYIILGNDKKFIWGYCVFKRIISTIFCVTVLFGILFQEAFKDPRIFFIDMTIKLLLGLVLGYIFGVMELKLYKTMLIKGEWNKKLTWKYIFLEGVLGWGMCCGIICNTFYPLDLFEVLSGMIIFALGGIFFGVAMRQLFDFKIFKQVVEQIKQEHI